MFRSLSMLACALALACRPGAEPATSSSGPATGASEDDDSATVAATSDTGAEDGTEGTGAIAPCAPTLEDLQEVVFTPRCGLVACHDDGSSPAAGLDLLSAEVEDRLVGEPSGSCESGDVRVIPGNRDASLLYTKLLETVACGERMPSGGVLPDAHIECVGAWIDALPPLACDTCETDACVDLQADAAHCGGCDLACPGGVPCRDGVCSCDGEAEICAGACVSTASDPAHCGRCDNACDPGLVCLAGACTDDCGALTDCSGACVDAQTDSFHCGGCGLACPSGGMCTAGRCDCPGDGVSFANDIEPILVAECTGMGCHGFPNASADLDLRSGMAHDELVGVASTQCADRLLVAPSDLGASYLMDKLEGVDLCFGTKMPKANQSLAASEIAAISEWICRGALDD